jgi:hypothetical protein
VEQAGDAGQREAVRTRTDLALRIAQQRAGLPREEAIRAISDMTFARIMATALLRKNEVVNAESTGYNAAQKLLEAQMAADLAAHRTYEARHVNSTGRASSIAVIAAIDRAGRMAGHNRKFLRLNHDLQQHHKELIALCEAGQAASWRLPKDLACSLDNKLATARLNQFTALSRQIKGQGDLLLWDCFNPHPRVFDGLQIEELVPVVTKLTTCDTEKIFKRLESLPEGTQNPLLAEEREAIDSIRLTAADCAAYMPALADKLEAGSGVTFAGESDRSIRDQAIKHLSALEETCWELADMARTLLQPAPPQAAASSSQETHTSQAKPRAGPKAKGKKHAAARVQTRPAAQSPAGRTAGRGEAVPAARPPDAATPPRAVELPPPAPSADKVRAWVSQLARLLEQDPRPAHREEFQQLCKVSAPEKLVSSRRHHAGELETLATNLLSLQEKLAPRHLDLLDPDELQHASSLRNHAATFAAQLRGEAQALTRDIDQLRLDLMKTYLLPEQSHWDELLDKGQARAVQLPQALPASPPDTLFEVELQPAPLTGQDQPPPSVWLHLHTGQAADAARLHTLPPAAFTAMHLKSDLERRRGRKWQDRQAAQGLPKERIHRGQVDKRFVDKVIGLARRTQGAPGVQPG